MADVIRAVDGPLVSVHGRRPESVFYDEPTQLLQPVWIAARSALREVFEAVTLRHLAEQSLPEAVQERTRDKEAWRPH